MPVTVLVASAGLHRDGIADADQAGGDLSGVAAVVAEVLAGRRLGPDDELDREAQRLGVRRADGGELFEVCEQARPVIPRRTVRPVDDIVTIEGRDRDRGDVVETEAAGRLEHLVRHAVVGLLVEVDQVDLVDHDDDVRHAQQRGDGQVAAGLLLDAMAYVDQEDDDVGGAGAGDGVAGVLHVAGAVREDERPLGCGEVAVGDIDRDALLALGPQAVGEQREVCGCEAAVTADPLDGVELVGEHGLRVVQQASDKGGLAVVDRAGGRQAEERPHQK